MTRNNFLPSVQFVMPIFSRSPSFKCLVFLILLTSQVFGYDRVGNQKNSQGSITQEGWVTVVTLNGTWSEMGMQYGKLLKTEINQIYNIFVNGLFAKHGIPYERLRSVLYDNAWPGISQHQKELFRGAAITSGLSVDQLFVLDQISFGFELFADELEFGTPTSLGCSFMATWGGYTDNGQLIAARNFDWVSLYREYAQLLTVVVFNPIDGSIPTANIAYAGFLGSSVTAINKNGLMAEINSAVESMGRLIYTDRSTITNELLDIVLSSDSLAALEMRIKTVRSNCPLIINIANGTEAYSIEDAPNRVMRRKTKQPGVLIATNEFRKPEWGIPQMEKPSLPLRRYKNLATLAEVYKGDYNVTTMQQVFELPIVNPDGSLGPGPTVYNKTLPGDFHKTVHSIVATLDPKPVLWIKVPGDTSRDWQRVDIYKYFK